ncbi:hypothetical protein [Nocardia farcinica]|uniref:hypothetical protein n=1 Tax=Nocardia farcinica TaxID=37329 RepID=UPI0015599CDA|nr:hypothetical protein [Nocardia farcinica]
MKVIDRDGKLYEFKSAAGFKTEEEHNNLEVIGSDGRIVAAWSGGAWSGAVMLDG